VLTLACTIGCAALLAGCVTRVAAWTSAPAASVVPSADRAPGQPSDQPDPSSEITPSGESEPSRMAGSAGPTGPGTAAVSVGFTWPERFGPAHERGPARGVIVPLTGPLKDWRGVHLGEFHQLHAGTPEREDIAALTAATGDRDRPVVFRTEGPGSYVFTQPIKPGDEVPKGPRPGDPVLFKHVQGRSPLTVPAGPAFATDPAAGDAGTEPRPVLLERTWFSFAVPADGVAASRGIVVLLPGMFGTPEPVVDGLERSLRAAGWAVLRLRAHPSRFTERLAVAIEDGAEPDAAELFAREMGERATSCAVAVRDALDHVLAAEHPELTGRPIVLLGMSGGAIALPTVHALDPDRYAAAVLIAGGVNYLRIDLESSYASWIDAIDIDWTPGDVSDDAERQPVPPGRGARLSEAYLAAAPLDGYHTAPLLSGKPVLMVHGGADRAVPAASGDLLWERAGRPERWILPVGHELLFISLPTQVSRIISWLDRQVPRAGPGAGDTP
jgi:fermentation-respiration switch protein FrsA (DUF1100 family)